VDEIEELAGHLAEARMGNQQALGTLLVGLRPWVRGRAQFMLGQLLRARVDGSDIVQEVHLRAFGRFDEFRGATVPQLLAWLQTILGNVIVDCRRYHGAHGRDVDAEEPGGDHFPALPADGTTPSQGAIRNEQQARLTEALQRLPEKYRQVVYMQVYQGLSYEEIAPRVGVSANYARVLMVRATEKLRKELGDDHA
jgi:RNA polymerase sigma-70 factor, ECF subfamily